MTIENLNKKAKEVFEQYNNETTLYCIDDGNFWLSKNKGSAVSYSRKLNKELITINKEDIKADTKKKPLKKKAINNNKK